MQSPATLSTASPTGRALWCPANTGQTISYSGNEGVTANFKRCVWLLNMAQGEHSLISNLFEQVNCRSRIIYNAQAHAEQCYAEGVPSHSVQREQGDWIGWFQQGESGVDSLPGA